LVYMKARRDHLPLVRAAEKHFGSWVRHCSRLGSIPTYASFTTNGGSRGKQYAPRSGATGKSVPRYFARSCPRWKGYLAIVLREPGRNTSAQAINGHCLQCGHRLAWILFRRQRSTRRGELQLNPQKTLEREAMLKRLAESTWRSPPAST
jgi:hypothetical protein